MSTPFSSKFIVLIILDGWGIAPPSSGNAITLARTPVYGALLKKYPHSQLITHGLKVGLPPLQRGNSEAGHMNLGAGRIVLQDAVTISRSINDGSFFRSPALLGALRHAKNNHSSVHLMGLLTGEHSGHAYPEHLLALLTFFRAQKFRPVYLHLFTDGRDFYEYAALELVQELQKIFFNHEKISTLMGRFYAMDRNKRWDRTAKAYSAMVLGQGLAAKNAKQALLDAYQRGEYDEYVLPNVFLSRKKIPGLMRDHDAVIFFNLRSDRARQLAKPFVQKNFESRGGFERKKILRDLFFVALTDFGPDLDSVITAYPAKQIQDTLPMVLGSRMKQLYIAESEKYAHVTYFFNGGYADPVAGEDRVMIPSPHSAHYDQTPLMSTKKITKYVCREIGKEKYQFMAINFAAPDMIAHTGNISAGISTVEGIDEALGEIIKAVQKRDGTVIITADHGNIEEMIQYQTGERNTSHSKYPVPCILVDKHLENISIKNGILADVSPTILKLFRIPKPERMTGKSLF